jgi:3D (Asp-Asp-Asp) domain-containing protein
MTLKEFRALRPLVSIRTLIATFGQMVQKGWRGLCVALSASRRTIAATVQILKNGYQALQPVWVAIAAVLRFLGKGIQEIASLLEALLNGLWAVIAFIPKLVVWVGRAVSSVGTAIRHLRAAIVGALITGTTVLLCLAVNNEDVFSSTYFLITSTFASDRIQFFNLSQRAVWLQVNATPAQATPINLWATYYLIHQAPSIPNGKPLLDRDGHLLGPLLSDQDWCHAAMEGTVQIDDGRGFLTTYNFVSRGETTQVDCSPYFPSLAADIVANVNKSRFMLSSSAYGYGTDNIPLVPYRTIAVDRSQIPIGSVVFIPDARGKAVTLPTGDRVVHDGFFYAADVGGAIQGSHIDVFLGTAQRNPFSFIASTPNAPFRAYLIRDPDIVQALKMLHKV